MKKSIVYTDESGDFECKKGTRWFDVTAVLAVKRKNSDAIIIS